METINQLNKLMLDFYKAWEFENTEEQFINLNGELDTTEELTTNIQKFQEMTLAIEKFINDENNFETIVENWDSINQGLLDTLISTFEIEIENFVAKVEKEDVRKEIKEFILERN